MTRPLTPGYPQAPTPRLWKSGFLASGDMLRAGRNRDLLIIASHGVALVLAP